MYTPLALVFALRLVLHSSGFLYIGIPYWYKRAGAESFAGYFKVVRTLLCNFREYVVKASQVFYKWTEHF
jgi:hypothetical protein